MKKPDIQAKLNQLRETFSIAKAERKPRQYAAEILRLRTKEERRAALDKVPVEIRSIVEFYVAEHFAKVFKRPLPSLARRTAEPR